MPVVFNLAGGYQGELTVALHLNTVRVALGLFRRQGARPLFPESC